jgi:hypothetical protein
VPKQPGSQQRPADDPYSLTEARVIFELAGRDHPDAEEERHRSFGHDLIGQTWRLPPP